MPLDTKDLRVISVTLQSDQRWAVASEREIPFLRLDCKGAYEVDRLRRPNAPSRPKFDGEPGEPQVGTITLPILDVHIALSEYPKAHAQVPAAWTEFQAQAFSPATNQPR